MINITPDKVEDAQDMQELEFDESTEGEECEAAKYLDLTNERQEAIIEIIIEEEK